MAENRWIPADTFGARLLLIRRQKRMTVEAIAKACGVAHPTWTTWENGAHPRDVVGAVQKISDALGVDRDWLMWGGALAGVNKRAFLSPDLGVSSLVAA
jgi:transcriptional regulator with XRE-family HTH domain